MSTEDIVFNLEVNVEKAVSSSRKLELVIFRTVGLWARLCRILGIPEDSPLLNIVSRIQSLIMTVRQLHTSIVMLEAASGPIGWAMFGISAAGTTMAGIDLAQQWGSTQA